MPISSVTTGALDALRQIVFWPGDTLLTWLQTSHPQVASWLGLSTAGQGGLASAVLSVSVGWGLFSGLCHLILLVTQFWEGQAARTTPRLRAGRRGDPWPLEARHTKEETARMITREEAWKLLCEWTQTESLRKHARAVEIVMRQAAYRYGAGDADVEPWGVAGMLHDADYEQWPEEHPKRTVAWLQERGEAEIAHAISAHYTKWGVPYETALDKALLACDELTGFIIAACLVRPEGVATLTPKSVRKKLKDKAFAAKVERDEIQKGAELLGVDLADHIQFVIDALKPHADELGIGPRA